MKPRNIFNYILTVYLKKFYLFSGEKFRSNNSSGDDKKPVFKITIHIKRRNIYILYMRNDTCKKKRKKDVSAKRSRVTGECFFELFLTGENLSCNVFYCDKLKVKTCFD